MLQALETLWATTGGPLAPALSGSHPFCSLYKHLLGISVADGRKRNICHLPLRGRRLRGGDWLEVRHPLRLPHSAHIGLARPVYFNWQGNKHSTLVIVDVNSLNTVIFLLYKMIYSKSRCKSCLMLSSLV